MDERYLTRCGIYQKYWKDLDRREPDAFMRFEVERDGNKIVRSDDDQQRDFRALRDNPEDWLLKSPLFVFASMPTDDFALSHAYRFMYDIGDYINPVAVNCAYPAKLTRERINRGRGKYDGYDFFIIHNIMSDAESWRRGAMRDLVREYEMFPRILCLATSNPETFALEQLNLEPDYCFYWYGRQYGGNFF